VTRDLIVAFLVFALGALGIDLPIRLVLLAVGVVKWLRLPTLTENLGVPVAASNPSRIPLLICSDQTTPPETIGGPYRVVLTDHGSVNVEPFNWSACRPFRHPT